MGKHFNPTQRNTTHVQRPNYQKLSAHVDARSGQLRSCRTAPAHGIAIKSSSKTHIHRPPQRRIERERPFPLSLSTKLSFSLLHVTDVFLSPRKHTLQPLPQRPRDWLRQRLQQRTLPRRSELERKREREKGVVAGRHAGQFTPPACIMHTHAIFAFLSLSMPPFGTSIFFPLVCLRDL